MNIPRITDALEHIDEKHISEAMDYRKTNNSSSWLKYGVLAACAVFAVAVAVFAVRQSRIPVIPDITPAPPVTEPTVTAPPEESTVLTTEPAVTNPPQSTAPDVTGGAESNTTVREHIYTLPSDTKVDEGDPVTEDLPKLTPSLSNSGMGFEGYMAYDISELVNANPWTADAEISTLPVYKNHNKWYLYNFPEYTDRDKMADILKYYAEMYGFDMQNLEVIDGHAPADYSGDDLDELFDEIFGIPVPEGVYQPSEIKATQNGITIEVDGEYGVSIRFDPTIALPDGYNFNYYMSYDEAEKVAEYFKIEYADWIDIDNPVTNITGGDYNIYADQGHDIEFYDGGGSITQQIINYNFRRIIFSCDSEGTLWRIRYARPNLDNKLGDYPIISADEALKMFEEGKYITTVVMWDMPGVEYVRKVELVYRTSKYDDYYIPYYKFYVEILEGTMKERTGLNTYGAYYVPAVAPEYIDEMTVWDGHFN